MDNPELDQVLHWIRNRFFGKYRGLVKDNKDSTNRGRIKVSVPAVLNDLEVWAMPCLPFTGKNMGSYTIPEPDAGVWVEFEGGDPSFAIWTGGFWADNELPKDEKNTAATPSTRMIKTAKGLMISFNDKSETITLSDKDGSNILSIKAQDGKIQLKGKVKIIVEAPAIELVENATHSLVFGDSLLQYLNQIVQTYATHTHPGQMAGPYPVSPMTPVPPMPAATPSLLSTKVKTG